MPVKRQFLDRLLAQRGDDVVALVTKNWRDFAVDKGGAVLHPDLIRDLSERGMATESVELYNGLSSFVDKHIRPILESDDELRDLLRANGHPTLHLKEWIDYHGREIAWKAGQPWPTEWPLVLFPRGPLDIRRVTDVVVRGVRILESDRREIELEARVEFGFLLSGYPPWAPQATACDMGCKISVGTYQEYPRVEPHWEEPLGGATEWVWHRVQLSLLLDMKSGEVQSFEVKGSHKAEDHMETGRQGPDNDQGDG